MPSWPLPRRECHRLGLGFVTFGREPGQFVAPLVGFDPLAPGVVEVNEFVQCLLAFPFPIRSDAPALQAFVSQHEERLGVCETPLGSRGRPSRVLARWSRP